jgi:hypothetical protein
MWKTSIFSEYYRQWAYPTLSKDKIILALKLRKGYIHETYPVR